MLSFCDERYSLVKDIIACRGTVTRNPKAQSNHGLNASFVRALFFLLLLMSFLKPSDSFCFPEARPRVLPSIWPYHWHLLHLIAHVPQPDTAHFSCGLHRGAARNYPWHFAPRLDFYDAVCHTQTTGLQRLRSKRGGGRNHSES
jgi:hypothetical protein